MRKETLFLLSALALSAQPALAVLNGERIADDRFPSVRKIAIGENGVCTGTFIGPRTMLTAGHCVEAALFHGAFSTSLALTVDGHRPTGWREHPLYENKSQGMLAYDVALIEFGADASYPVTPIAARAAGPGDAITIVGYGLNGGVAGLKRMGRNEIFDSMFGQFLIRGGYGEGSPATNTGGDSGGPLLNADGEVIGVTSRESGPGMEVDGVPVHTSSSIDLSQPEIRMFIEKAKADLDRAGARSGGEARRGD